MNKQTRTYEEIITLQDKAIEALTQANAALVMALEALKKARAEHGVTIPFPFPGLGQGQSGQLGSLGGYVPTPAPTYVPNTTEGIQWGSQTGIVTITNTANMTAAKAEAANSLIQQANSQKDLATAYVNAFQEYMKESDAGLCVH